MIGRASCSGIVAGTQIRRAAAETGDLIAVRTSLHHDDDRRHAPHLAMKQKLFTISAIAAAIFASPSFARPVAQPINRRPHRAAKRRAFGHDRIRPLPHLRTSLTTRLPPMCRATVGIRARQALPVLPSRAIQIVNGNAKSQTALPESMQIQRQTEQALPPPGDLIKKGGGPTTEAPPVELFEKRR